MDSTAGLSAAFRIALTACSHRSRLRGDSVLFRAAIFAPILLAGEYSVVAGDGIRAQPLG
jgi:hypothetical protein